MTVIDTTQLINSSVQVLKNSEEYDQYVADWLQAHPGYFLWNNSSMLWYTVIVMVLTSVIICSVVYSDKIIWFFKTIGGRKDA